MIEVPEQFRPLDKRPYPQDNLKGFEYWFFENYNPERNKSDRIYLPIQFTAYYNNHRHGRNWLAIQKLQHFIDQLDKKKKYFTLIQFDDGFLNKFNGLDLKTFGTGCKGDVQLPLVCQPHKYNFDHLESTRPIFASFVGSITHNIREQLVRELKGKKGYYISTEPTSLEAYCYILNQSKYVLCCRGYGKTSFRIQEALQYGAKPIYISDEHLYEIGCISVNTINEAVEFIEDHPVTNPECNEDIFKNHYTFEAASNLIYESLGK